MLPSTILPHDRASFPPRINFGNGRNARPQTRLNALRYVGADPDFANAPPPAREAEADYRDRATAYTFAGGD